MFDYQRCYDSWTMPFRRHPMLISLLRLSNFLLTHLMYVIYPLLLLLIYITQGFSQLFGIIVIVPAISFSLVSLFRHFYNQPRPYETWNFSPLIAKTSQGKSMPSRHVFSASMISMCVLRLSIPLGLILLSLSLVLAFCRVIGGVHYPKDVLVGYVLGFSVGFLLFLV
ncbi:phosphatase PAP2 family protein [Streptococcus sciuri]|uniref:Phosphatase PAP2 family protein n=1 Tax=Streptococcus sciuri TaxID=2973939 RepID=A0ABT2F8V7_9STRE|nr:phosphatase PAP2 family protein [Streptococcus sciuri]MCS4488262.1 phosphatase PAP2 family protein [Streptococcus sciuri]